MHDQSSNSTLCHLHTAHAQWYDVRLCGFAMHDCFIVMHMRHHDNVAGQHRKRTGDKRKRRARTELLFRVTRVRAGRGPSVAPT